MNLAAMAKPMFDREREQLIAERLQQRVTVGEPVNIKSGKHEYLALYTVQSTRNPKGAVLLLHSMAAHPDWPGVINQLRQSLPEYGWSTLSIQLPILVEEWPIADYGKTLDESARRIKAAVKHLQSLEYEHIVLVGYGFGAATGMVSVSKSNPGVLGLVGISMLAQSYLRPQISIETELETLKLPVLDIYGSQDRASIIETAADRYQAARKAENPNFKQIVIGGADHHFSDQEVILVKRILAWLNQLIANYSVSQDNE